MIAINKKNIAGFLENYQMGRLLAYKKIKFGFANNIIKLKTDQGEYILKIVIRNNPYRVKYEVNLLNYLNGLPVPVPVKSKNGKYLLDYGSNKAFIYKFIKGEQLSEFEGSALEQVGELLAKIHLKGAYFKSNIRRFELYAVKNKFKEMVGKSRRVGDRIIRDNIDYVEKNLPRYFLPDSLSQGVIHTDFKPENTIFLNNQVNGLVDFDNSYRGVLILDLAITMMWFCSRGKFNVSDAAIICGAYNRIRKLTKIEKEYLFEAIHYVHISVALLVFYTYAVNRNGFALKEKGWYVTDLKKFKRYMKWIAVNFLKAEKDFDLTKEDFDYEFNRRF